MSFLRVLFLLALLLAASEVTLSEDPPSGGLSHELSYSAH